MRKLLPVTAAATALIFACSGGVAAAAAPAE
jgi:hypothetical protein